MQAGPLPWRARLTIEEARDSIARRRGEGGAPAPDRARQGCLQRMHWIGSGGQLSPPGPRPGSQPGAAIAARAVEASGCILTLPERRRPAGRPRRCARRSSPARGRVLFVLDYAGPALIRIDGGPFIEHGSARAFGPRASAVAVDARSPGRHTVELRLGSYGGGAQLRAFVFDPAPARDAGPAGIAPEAGRPLGAGRPR